MKNIEFQKGLQTADLDWVKVDDIEIPVSKQFGDVYFSKDNGLLETRHVFLRGNDLPERLAQLTDYQYFVVGETGFGTGLNILALWQLWQQVRPDNHSHLHAISVEKFPLSKSDLIRALQVWQELAPLSEQLIAQYPHPIPGCHRLYFPQERFSIDLWLGDAIDIFPQMIKTKAVDAWFLDGFAPSCNPELWQQNILDHIIRLSDVGSTFASFSVAGLLKRGLSAHGIDITRPRGFGHKREMLKAFWPRSNDLSIESPKIQEPKQQQIAIVGAGIAGLNMAWAFAKRGHKVKLLDQATPLSGGSGNPLALLNPKLSPIEQSHEHLMTLSWHHAINFYRSFKAFRPLTVNQLPLKDTDILLSLANQYPKEVLELNESDTHASLKLKLAGALSPHLFCDEVLSHPLIDFQQATVTRIAAEDELSVTIQTQCQQNLKVDHAIVCCAKDSAALLANYPTLKPIRGQVSWAKTSTPLFNLDQAWSYGGYCLQKDVQHIILGASFHPQREDTAVLHEDHVHNYELIHKHFPNDAQQLPDISTWQGRASIRAQTSDYLPVLGSISEQKRITTFAGLGSKGFLFAPLCSEVLVAEILGESCPIPKSLREKLQAQRFQKKNKVRKPYFREKTLS